MSADMVIIPAMTLDFFVFCISAVDFWLPELLSKVLCFFVLRRPSVERASSVLAYAAHRCVLAYGNIKPHVLVSNARPSHILHTRMVLLMVAPPVRSAPPHP